MIDNASRFAWTKLITAADLDDHMHQVGQAEANAALLQLMLAENTEGTANKLLIAGGGTGQFLDYVSAAAFLRYDITFGDINPGFLEQARARFERAGLPNAQFVVDDIEATQLTGAFDIIVMVLLLEHIDWRLGLRNIHRFAPHFLHIVIQRNPAGVRNPIAPGRTLNASMQAFEKTAQPALVETDLLIEFLRQLGYRLHGQLEQPVPDSKTMVGLSFCRQ